MNLAEFPLTILAKRIPEGLRKITYKDTIHGESAHERPGEEIVTAPLGELTIGLSVCYDLRFPELFRILALRGARLIALPSAFTLAKCVRDQQESSTLYQRIDQARVDKILAEHDPFQTPA